jgi:hypothetical protein
MKRDKLDVLFSKLVRERSGWRCECCGKQYEPNSQGLHCSHLVGRRHRGTRWHPDAAAAHCYSCHQKLGANPIVFRNWIVRHLGEARALAIQARAQAVCKLSKPDLKEIEMQLACLLREMNVARTRGRQGRIEFPSPYPSDHEREAA